MMHVKAVLIGLAAAAFTLVMGLLAGITYGIATALHEARAGESGGLGAVSVGLTEPVSVLTVVAFVVGYWLTIRRARRKGLKA